MALGRQLREARERKGLTCSQVAATTHLKVQVVEALEREVFDGIPAPIYGKGFIRLYAQLVGLDPGPLVDEYLDILGRTPENVPPPPPEPRRSNRPSSFGPVSPAANKPVADAVQEAAAQAGGVSVPQPPAEPDLFAIPARPASAPPARPPRHPLVPLALGRATRLVHRLRRRAATAATHLRQYAAGRANGLARRANAPAASNEPPIPAPPAFPIAWAGVIIGVAAILILLFSALSRFVGRPAETDPVHGADLQLAIQPPDAYVD